MTLVDALSKWQEHIVRDVAQWGAGEAMFGLMVASLIGVVVLLATIDHWGKK